MLIDASEILKMRDEFFLDNPQLLNPQNDQFRLIAESIPQLVWTANAKGELDYFNERWLKYTGLSLQDSLNPQKRVKIIHPKYLEEAQNKWTESLITKQPYEVEYRLRGADGNYRWFICRAIPIVGKNGKIVRWVGTITDIDESRLNAEKVSRYAAIIESSDDAIISKLLDGTITSWNSGAEKMYGYSEKEAVGKNISMLFPEDRKNELLEILEVLRLGEGIDHYQTQRQKKNGKIIDISVTISPIKDFFGNVIGASTIARDISYYKELERRKDAFIGMASHELKTPLTTLKALTQISQKLVQQDDTKNVKVYLLRINDQINRLIELVNDLLDLSKIESGKLELNKTEFDFNKLLKETIENIAYLSPSRKIIPEGKVKSLIKADRHRLEQVLINLIINALKYSPPNSRISISIGEELSKQSNIPTKIMFKIKDEGIGISSENIKNIFSRFYREAGIDEQTYPGLGIGLYISSEIIRRHGGNIWVESEKGNGSTFYFTLPLK